MKSLCLITFELGCKNFNNGSVISHVVSNWLGKLVPRENIFLKLQLFTYGQQPNPQNQSSGDWGRPEETRRSLSLQIVDLKWQPSV